MPIITVDNESLYATYNDNIIDFGASFRRYKRTNKGKTLVGFI